MKRKGNESHARAAVMRPPLAAHSSKESSDLLALGNPALDVKEVAKLSLLREDDLGPLPSAETEVNTLGQLYGRNRSKILVGNKATEEEAKAEAEKYRLLHFAAHAVLDDRNPMYSRIMLSRDEKGRWNAGTWELMKLDLLRSNARNRTRMTRAEASASRRSSYGTADTIIRLTGPGCVNRQ